MGHGCITFSNHSPARHTKHINAAIVGIPLKSPISSRRLTSSQARVRVGNEMGSLKMNMNDGINLLEPDRTHLSVIPPVRLTFLPHSMRTLTQFNLPLPQTHTYCPPIYVIGSNRNALQGLKSSILRAKNHQTTLTLARFFLSSLYIVVKAFTFPSINKVKHA